MRRQLIIVFGVPGTGKSTLAAELARTLKCVRIDTDFISEELRAQSLDTPDHRAMAYRMIETMVKNALATVDRVIVEAPLMAQTRYSSGSHHPDHFSAVASAIGAELKLIHLWCDEPLLLARLKQRDAARDSERITMEGVAALLQEQPMHLDPAVAQEHDVLSIDSATPLADQLARALGHIRKAVVRPTRSGEAWQACFGFKPPIIQGKDGSPSAVLWLFAVLFWLYRFIAPIQWVKFVLRSGWLHRSQDPIPPLIAELFTLVPIALLLFNLWCVAYGYTLVVLPLWLLFLLLGFQVVDVVLANLYYLLLRPIVDRDPPHNPFRSFILGWFGYLHLSLLLTTLWVYAASHSGLAQPEIAAIFSQVVKGDTGVVALARPFAALDLMAKIAFGVMLTVVLGRAVAVVPPLPSARQTT